MGLITATVASRLVELGPDDGRWLRFTEGASEATTFHHPAWLHALTASYGYPALVLAQLDSEGEVAAGVPLLRINRPFRAHTYACLPFTDHCAPLARDEASLQLLAAGLEDWLGRAGGAALEVRGFLPCSGSMQRVTLGVRHLLSLTGSEDDMRRRMTPAAGRHLRGARRAGVRVRFSCSMADLPVFYRLHLLTRRRLGVPMQPRRFLAAVWQRVVVPGLGFLAVAEAPSGQPIAACLMLTHKHRLVYKFAASDHSRWDLKPNHLLVGTVAQWGHEHGYEVLDFGRTELAHAGLRQFKASWGAVERPLEYTYIGRPGGLTGSGRIGRLMRTVISHSPPVVCRAVGELLYRYAA